MPGKTKNPLKYTPHNKGVAKIVRRYKANCEKLSQMITEFNIANDERDIAQLQSAIAAKAMELGGMILGKKPHIDKAVLKNEIKVLQATLKHKERIKDISSELAAKEMTLAGMKVQNKPNKDMVTLQGAIRTLKARLKSMEMTGAEKSELRKRIDKLRTCLGSDLGSLCQLYESELDGPTVAYLELTRKALKIVPCLVPVKPNENSGKGGR